MCEGLSSHLYMRMYSDLYFLLLCIVHQATVSHTYFKRKERSVCVLFKSYLYMIQVELCSAVVCVGVHHIWRTCSTFGSHTYT